MPAELELARREGVELIRTGRFQTLTGSWNPTPKDIRAAVEAMACPAIRKPVIRIGHTDQRFAPAGDGEPALGWFENLRATDGGHTLVADQVTLPWLHSVQAAAYPSRSIEGNYNHRCSEGHVHPFVIHTVALLGVTPPGVQTLRSLNDLPELLGVAASGEVPDGAEHVQVTVHAGRHSFDESKHQRDGDGKFASAPGGGEGGSVPAAASGLKRNDKVAARIPLADGETYAGSAAIRSAGIALAAVDGPDGRSVRLGVGIDPDEIGRWAGADRGGTVVLDQQGMNQLREAIPQMLEAGKAGKARWRQMDKEIDRLEAAGDQEALDAHNEAMAAFGDFSVLDEGTITGGWGDLHLRVLMSDGEPRYYLEAKTGTTAPTVSNELIEASHLRRLAKLLEQAGAAAPVQAAADVPAHLDGLREARAQIAASAEQPSDLDPTDGLPAVDDVTPPPEPAEVPAPVLPAAEPEQPLTDPKEEDPVSDTDLSGLRSRLGLTDDADQEQILSAIDALKAKADTPPVPSPEMVAASAAATRAIEQAETARAEMQTELQRLSGELASIRASAATSVKTALFDGAVTAGKIKPAERESWEGRYDRAPEVISEILASIAPGTAVPVMASGTVGSPEPGAGSDDDWDDIVARLDGPNAKAV
jgi:hypothetical protein